MTLEGDDIRGLLDRWLKLSDFSTPGMTTMFHDIYNDCLTALSDMEKQFQETVQENMDMQRILEDYDIHPE
jgi:hypothetical protein